MTTEIGALRRAFEAYINPDADVNLHWLAAGYYAGRGVQQSWLDFQAGYAAAKAEPADVGEPVAFTHFAENGNIRLWAPERPRDLDGNAVQPLYTADQLAAAVAAERISALCDTLLNRPARNAGLESEYAAEAAAKAETAAAVAGRWYFVANDGAATLCVDEADARESAAKAGIAFPRMAPHRAVQLVPAEPTQEMREMRCCHG